jgi:C4-dicarboxylate transporter
MKINWTLVLEIAIAGAILMAFDRLVLSKMLDKAEKLIGEDNEENS